MPFQKMHILRAQKSARSEGVGSVEQTKLSRLYFISIGHWLCHNLWSDGSTTTICLNLNAQAIWLNAVYIHSPKIAPNPIFYTETIYTGPNFTQPRNTLFPVSIFSCPDFLPRQNCRFFRHLYRLWDFH